jgi:hypothetical protein
MANGWYNAGLNLFATKGCSWPADAIKAALLDTGTYTVDLVNHATLASIPAGSRIASVALANKSVAGAGVLDADDATFPTVPAISATVEAILIYLDGASDAVRIPLLYIDTLDTGVFSIQPNGGDFFITWDNGANKIAKL